MSERESRPGESGPFVSTVQPSDEELVDGLANRRMEGWTTRPLTRTGGPLDAVPVTDGWPREIHGVLTDDPQLLSAVVKAIDGDDGAAVMIIAEKFRLSGVEAGEVLAAVLGDGKRPAGCFLNKRGRLEVMATAEEMQRSLSSQYTRTIHFAGLGVDPEAEKRVDALMSRHMADWKTYPLTLDTPSLTGLTLTMPSATHPSGVRSLSLEEIDEVFSALDEERRQTGEDLEDRAETLAWMRREVARLDAFESAFLAVNELCPPSDWLRDLKAASHDPDALVELRRRASAARAEKDGAGVPFTIPGHSVASEGSNGFEIEVRIPPGGLSMTVDTTRADRHNCHTCAHGGRFACNLFGFMRSEALTWRASNTTGDGCPGWEGKATGKGFQTPSAPAQPSPALFDTDQPDWLPDGWTHRLGVYVGPGGMRVFTDGSGRAVAWGSTHPDIEAWTEWTEQDKRALVMALADPWRVTGPGVDPLGRLGADGGFKIPANVIKSMGLNPGDFVYVVQDGDRFVLATSNQMQAALDGTTKPPTFEPAQPTPLPAMLAAAQSFILADTCLDATPYEKGAHDAATAILRGDLSTGDPRVTLRGQVEEARQTAHALESMLVQVKAERDRAQAVLAAETGKQGLPGWTWDEREREWSIYYRERAVRLTAWGTTVSGGPAFHARIGIKALSTGSNVSATDALDAMEKATAWARVRGYTGEAPDLEAIVPVQARTEIAHLWEHGVYSAAVEVYRSCFLEPMTYNEACNALDLYFGSKPKAEPTPPEDDYIPV